MSWSYMGSNTDGIIEALAEEFDESSVPVRCCRGQNDQLSAALTSWRSEVAGLVPTGALRLILP